MQINPYLHFNGNCEEAFHFYAEVLGGKIQTVFTFAGTPMAAHVPPAFQNKLMHASLLVGDVLLMGADATPDRYQPPAGFSVSLGITSVAEAERVFHALAEGGAVHMPIQQTFWAQRFGMLVDRFGIPWMVNCEGAAS